MKILKIFCSLRLFISGGLMVVVVTVGRQWFDIGVFIETPPDFSPLYLLRSGLLLVAAYIFSDFLTAPIKSDTISIEESLGQRVYLYGWIGTLAITLTSTGIFLVSPSLYSSLCLEDNLIETLSALCNFLGGFLLLLTLKRVVKAAQADRLLNSLILVSGAGLYFLIGLEEISWFQRVFEWDTPASFSGNVQDETNFHNFATDKLETGYYFCTVALGTMLPVFVRFRIPENSLRVLRPFLPPLQLVPMGILVSSLNYDMWNAPLTQWSLYTSIFLAFFLVKQINLSPGLRYQLILASGVGILCQLIYLIGGYRFVRLWDVTEYKELLISISLLMYAYHVFTQLKRKKDLPGS